MKVPNRNNCRCY